MQCPVDYCDHQALLRSSYSKYIVAHLEVKQAIVAFFVLSVDFIAVYIPQSSTEFQGQWKRELSELGSITSIIWTSIIHTLDLNLSRKFITP